ncbi:hypothetical protein BU14_0197s0014 [Porphyra umbilicalis]|uniref:Uncharacterized protein n=1 Tax=Porphyra umbilicalis TaxID=2786 RepID=A0A1X6P641_PORUM|nr:hypothetical protein BU14_0197s0014 [Porphyra umbilicalis]|eukprot:OSX76318.1 hypothetical protein BU14_0197s0014 [Porphyra umbilicalis]
MVAPDASCLVLSQRQTRRVGCIGFVRALEDKDRMDASSSVRPAAVHRINGATRRAYDAAHPCSAILTRALLRMHRAKRRARGRKIVLALQKHKSEWPTSCGRHLCQPH